MNLENSFIFASQFNFSLVTFPSGADLTPDRFNSICIRCSRSSRPDSTDDHGRKSSTVKLSSNSPAVRLPILRSIGFALRSKLITKIARNSGSFKSKPDDFPRLNCRKTIMRLKVSFPDYFRTDRRSLCLRLIDRDDLLRNKIANLLRSETIRDVIVRLGHNVDEMTSECAVRNGSSI